MKDNYDFSNAKKNPFAEKLKNGYTVRIDHGDHFEIISIKKERRKKDDNGGISAERYVPAGHAE